MCCQACAALHIYPRTGEIPQVTRGRQMRLLLPRPRASFTWSTGTDTFVCHAGEEKPFARLLRNSLQKLGLRCFVDEDDLRVADNAQRAMDAALLTTHSAVILLCHDFFQKEAPHKELRQILDDHRAFFNELVPVFLGVSVEEFENLAQPAGLADICVQSGVRHAYERHRFQSKPVHREETMQRIVREICRMTGLQSPFLVAVRLMMRGDCNLIPECCCAVMIK